MVLKSIRYRLKEIRYGIKSKNKGKKEKEKSEECQIVWRKSKVQREKKVKNWEREIMTRDRKHGEVREREIESEPTGTHTHTFRIK